MHCKCILSRIVVEGILKRDLMDTKNFAILIEMLNV